VEYAIRIIGLGDGCPA